MQQRHAQRTTKLLFFLSLLPLLIVFVAALGLLTADTAWADTFTITASAGAHGTISPSGSVVVSGGTSTTFTITPNASYHVSDVLVDGASVGRVTSYLFSSVTATHSISATFASDTIITGRFITSNTTWTLAGSPYTVTGDITVGSPTSSPMLTIEAGVVVKFNNSTGLYISNSLGYLGALHAVGTTAAPILFTSSDPSPAPGKWCGITFNGGTISANTVLDNVTVEYGGNAGTKNISIGGSSPTIRNSIIQKSSGPGMYITNGASPLIQNNTITNNGLYGISINSASPSITGNIISNNTNTGIVVTSGAPSITGNVITNNTGYGIYDNTGTAALISGNTISGNGSYPVRMGVMQTANSNTYGTNGINGVEVSSGTIGQNLTMKNNGLPYIITTDILVGSSSSPVLTIEAGLTLKFNNGTVCNIANGSGPGALRALGTAQTPSSLRRMTLHLYRASGRE